MRRYCVSGPPKHALRPTYYNFTSLEFLDAIAVRTPWKSLSSLPSLSSRLTHIYITSDDLATFLSTEPHERDFQNLTDFRLILDDSG